MKVELPTLLNQCSTVTPGEANLQAEENPETYHSPQGSDVNTIKSFILRNIS